MSSQQEYDGSHAMRLSSNCYEMLATGRPNPHYKMMQQWYPGVRYISPYASPNVIMEYKPFIELNKYIATGGHKPYNLEKMARNFRQFPLVGEDRNNYMRSKM